LSCGYQRRAGAAPSTRSNPEGQQIANRFRSTVSGVKFLQYQTPQHLGDFEIQEVRSFAIGRRAGIQNNGGLRHYHGDFVKVGEAWYIKTLVQTRLKMDFTK
jgi:hypothetical protein